MTKTKSPVLGIILDGFGISDIIEGNPIKHAKMPFYQSLLKDYPNTQIQASEEYVGLPKKQMGNSEVGHLNLGAGKCIYQDLMRINNAIKDKTFFKNPVIVEQLQRVVKNDSVLHLVGLVSDGGVHSSLEHLLALIDMAKQSGVKKLKVHCITDGRDTPKNSGKEFVLQVQKKLITSKLGEIATICGRFYAMDREERWNRTKKAFEAMAYGKGEKVSDIDKVFDVEYEKQTSDEFFPTYVLGNYEGVNKNDEMLFFNFRPDRMRQLVGAFSSKCFNGFNRTLPKIKCVSMCQYDARFLGVKVAFAPEHPTQTLSKYLSELGYSQLKVAETTKYAHVTYYFNGGVEKPYKKEDRILIESENVDNFADYPQMKAMEIVDAVEKVLSQEKYDMILINISNCDMVGHTGNYNASIKALETVDKALKKVVEAAIQMGYTCIITADHGNIEDERAKSPNLTTHTINPVPLIITDRGIKLKKGKFALDSFAPTILDIMNIEKPLCMTGLSLIK